MSDATPPTDPPPPPGPSRGSSDASVSTGGSGAPGRSERSDLPDRLAHPWAADPAEPSARRLAAIALATLAAVIAVYYTLPIYAHSHGTWAPARIVAFVAGLVALTWLFLRQVSEARRAAPSQVRAQWLFTGICVTVVLFAVTYYSLACSTHQMAGIRTKTDSLYFTVTVLTTVGFGDVRAVGQVGRVVVTIQMGFDVLFVATAGSALRASGAARRGRLPQS